ncbi:MAG: chaplin family protein [Streptosporangiaceae bacterium]
MNARRRSLALAALTSGLMVGGSAALGTGALADTSGEGGLLSGNQIIASITAPIDLSGNAVTVLGETEAAAQGSTVAEQDDPPQLSTSGDNGTLSGNQVFAPIQIPINACGNAVGIAGEAEAGCEVEVKTSSGGGGHHAGGHGGGGGGDGDDEHDGGDSGGGNNDGSTGGGSHGGGPDGGGGGGSSTGTSSHDNTGIGAAAVPAHSNANTHQDKGGLPRTGAPTSLLAGLGASALAAGAILMTIGRRRRTGAAEGGTATS